MKKPILLLAFLFAFSSAFISCRETTESEEVEDVELNENNPDLNESETEGEGLDEVEAEFEEAGDEVRGELEEASDEAIDETSEEVDENLNIDNETEDAGL